MVFGKLAHRLYAMMYEVDLYGPQTYNINDLAITLLTNKQNLKKRIKRLNEISPYKGEYIKFQGYSVVTFSRK